MTPRHANLAVFGSVVILTGVFGLAIVQGDKAMVTRLTRALFVATLLLEGCALVLAIVARRLFSSGDAGWRTWGFIVAFLAVRIAAELRLLTINFGWIPSSIADHPDALWFYKVVLRYLYTVSDLLFVAALWLTLAAYRSTGLQFRLLARDWVYAGLVWSLPAAVFVQRENLALLYVHPDPNIATYRLVAVLVGALIVSLCLFVRRFVLQMGGGALAKVWNAVIFAGVARATSFLALAALSAPWPTGATFVEQILLWCFACGWVLAALRQRSLVRL